MAQFEGIFQLCYLRGPAGIIVALAETDRLTRFCRGTAANPDRREDEAVGSLKCSTWWGRCTDISACIRVLSRLLRLLGNVDMD